MSWRDPRRDLLLCACLDLLGLVVALLALINLRGLSFQGQGGWIVTTLATYLVMGWLLGTYTLLGWRRLPRWTLLQRLGLTLLASLLVMAVLTWLLNPPLAVWVVYRSNQLSLMLPVVVWSGLVRVALHRGALRLRSRSYCW
ncbi:hypothetical protein [Synechococcus sp. GFB01]|uniref:hypothetical protein n=1 Tax=Synechococcus sp. GFB01 TaxID=1662190 RepID=UPI001F49002B|nr:hypothetical protein [Synechococcus sp. GFB01]